MDGQLAKRARLSQKPHKQPKKRALTAIDKFKSMQILLNDCRALWCIGYRRGINMQPMLSMGFIKSPELVRPRIEYNIDYPEDPTTIPRYVLNGEEFMKVRVFGFGKKNIVMTPTALYPHMMC